MTNRCPTSDFYPQYDSTVATNGPEAQKVTFPSDPLTSPRERSPKLDMIDRQLAPRGDEVGFLDGIQKAFDSKDGDFIGHVSQTLRMSKTRTLCWLPLADLSPDHTQECYGGSGGRSMKRVEYRCFKRGLLPQHRLCPARKRTILEFC
jgi:hypothetical protein